MTATELPAPEGHLTVDVLHSGHDIVVRSAVAGVAEKDLEISVTKDSITIRGTRTPEHTARDNYLHRELYWGTFSRTILLPEEVRAEAAVASIKNGILTVRMRKAAAPKNIAIRNS